MGDSSALLTGYEKRFEVGYYFTKGIRFWKLAEGIQRINPGNLLVLGCGNGYLESLLSSSISILSVDISNEDLDVARYLNRNKSNRDFRFLDMFDVDEIVEQGSFSAVAISEVAEHVEDDLKLLEIAHKCLKQGGKLFLTVPNVGRLQNRPRLFLKRKPKYMAHDHLREYTLSDSSALVHKAGFRLESVEGLDLWLPKDPYIRSVIPFGSPFRQAIASRWPGISTWFMLVGSKSGAKT
jgi:SAM-dependent methyltransferase